MLTPEETIRTGTVGQRKLFKQRKKLAPKLKVTQTARAPRPISPIERILVSEFIGKIEEIDAGVASAGRGNSPSYVEFFLELLKFATLHALESILAGQSL